MLQYIFSHVDYAAKIRFEVSVAVFQKKRLKLYFRPLPHAEFPLYKISFTYWPYPNNTNTPTQHPPADHTPFTKKTQSFWVAELLLGLSECSIFRMFYFRPRLATCTNGRGNSTVLAPIPCNQLNIWKFCLAKIKLNKKKMKISLVDVEWSSGTVPRFGAIMWTKEWDNGEHCPRSRVWPLSDGKIGGGTPDGFYSPHGLLKGKVIFRKVAVAFIILTLSGWNFLCKFSGTSSISLVWLIWEISKWWFSKNRFLGHFYQFWAGCISKSDGSPCPEEDYHYCSHVLYHTSLLFFTRLWTWIHVPWKGTVQNDVTIIQNPIFEIKLKIHTIFECGKALYFSIIFNFFHSSVK